MFLSLLGGYAGLGNDLRCMFVCMIEAPLNIQGRLFR